MTISMSLGLLILRLVIGLTLAAHGAQKLFGWFGGSGFNGALKAQERMGLKPSLLWTCLVIVGELGGGLSLALGLLAPLGAAGAFGAMCMAIMKVHWKNGFWNGKRGIEFPLSLLAAATTIGIIGPGNYSLDTLFRIALPEIALFCILAAAALLLDVIGLAISRQAASTTAPSGATPRPS